MKNPTHPEIIVAGLICLDIILTFEGYSGDVNKLIRPGKAINVGNAMIATGGAVANTGLALHQLGIPTRLIAKIGQDQFGDAILDVLEERGADTTGMMVIAGENTSYSIVISPPGIDRSFLYNPGANDTLQTSEFPLDQLDSARYFHFGYPPEMRHMYIDGGVQFSHLLQEVKQKGLTVSMDVSFPDFDSEAGEIDWRNWLQQVMPFVDVFLPSFEELYAMLDRKSYQEQEQAGTLTLSKVLLEDLSHQILDMGTAIVIVKLGDQGLYMQTSSNPDRISAIGKGMPSNQQTWIGRSFYAPCFETQVVGTTGAGDCTIAGFLAGMSKNLSPEHILRMATAVGAFSVEQADASSGVPHWDIVRKRVQAGWQQLEQSIVDSR